ncbi:MAG: hypothetical protein OEQ74_02060 [Gammaproteobacteria bacterium]|nr:hypothetical protein [Gammaproteobacteria bacterium]
MTNKYFRVLLGIVASALIASTASANLLSNPSFEDPAFGGVEVPGAGNGWTSFGNAFRIQCEPAPVVGPCPSGGEPISGSGNPGAHDGSVVLKGFGGSGAYQDFAASEGQTYSGSVWALDPNNGDVLRDNGQAELLIIFFGGGNILDTFVDVLAQGGPLDTWTLLSVMGVAPAGTDTVRFQVGQNGGGAPRLDDAYFNLVPIPGAILLMGSGLLGLMGFRRKKVA